MGYVRRHKVLLRNIITTFVANVHFREKIKEEIHCKDRIRAPGKATEVFLH